MTANPVRGEVDVTLWGETFTLVGTFGNVARLQYALGVEGLLPVFKLIASSDARALMQGLACLSDPPIDAAIIALKPFPANYLDLQQAIVTCLTGPPEPDAKNGEGATGSLSQDISPRADG